MNADADNYIKAVVDMYVSLPDTPDRASSLDRAFAHHLYQQGVSLIVVETAFLTASLRRIYRDPSYPPLQPIRSMRYFSPVIEEAMAGAPSPSYLRYLRTKLQHYRSSLSSAHKTHPTSSAEDSK